MPITEQHIRELLEKHLQQQLSDSEKQELLAVIREDEAAFMRVAQSVPVAFGADASFSLGDREGILAAIFRADDERLSGVRVMRPWLRWVAAAIIILTIGAVAYLWKPQKQQTPVVTIHPAPVQNDVSAPSVSRATLTLASGKQIFIDNSMNGILATQGNVNIHKMNDGRIVYNGKGEAGQIQYNTFTVPRGSQIASLVLSDGSKVFLNAASSLKYPVAFIGNERRVEVTGEAYFEVAKDPSKKFIVSGGGMTTEVLGTHFNVNAYSDEGATKVTLLEGSVRVVGGVSNVVIKPGVQAEFTSGVMQVNQSVDVEQVMAWKNGLFNFKDADLPAVMRQLERWYDIQAVYQGKPGRYKFQGKLQRDLTLSQVLRILGEVEVKFKIEGKKLLVTE